MDHYKELVDLALKCSKVGSIPPGESAEHCLKVFNEFANAHNAAPPYLKILWNQMMEGAIRAEFIRNPDFLANLMALDLRASMAMKESAR